MKKSLVLIVLFLVSCSSNINPTAKQQNQLCDVEMHTQQSIQSYEDIMRYLHEPVPNVLAAMDAAKRGEEHAKKAQSSSAQAAQTGLDIDGKFEKLQQRNTELENSWFSPRQKRDILWISLGLTGIIVLFWSSPTPLKIAKATWGLVKTYVL